MSEIPAGCDGCAMIEKCAHLSMGGQCTDSIVAEREALRAKLAEVTKDRDNWAVDRNRLDRIIKTLVEALEGLLRVDDEWHGAVNSEMAHARSKARTALASVKGEK